MGNGRYGVVTVTVTVPPQKRKNRCIYIIFFSRENSRDIFPATRTSGIGKSRNFLSGNSISRDIKNRFRELNFRPKILREFPIPEFSLPGNRFRESGFPEIFRAELNFPGSIFNIPGNLVPTLKNSGNPDSRNLFPGKLNSGIGNSRNILSGKFNSRDNKNRPRKISFRSKNIGKFRFPNLGFYSNEIAIGYIFYKKCPTILI